MSKADEEILKEEDQALKEGFSVDPKGISEVDAQKLLEKIASEKKPLIDAFFDSLFKSEIDAIKANQETKEELSKPREVVIKGQPRVIVEFPQVQQVRGLVKILDSVALKIENFPGVQKIFGKVEAIVKFPALQKIFGKVEANVTNFPDIQKVEIDFPDIQKVKGEVELKNFPKIKYNDVEAIPVVFFNGKRFVDPVTSIVNANGRLTALLEQIYARQEAPKNLYNGAKVATSSAVALGISQDISSITVKALAGNTVKVYVGNASVTDATGIELSASESVSLAVKNVADVFIIAPTGSPEVRFIAV